MTQTESPLDQLSITDLNMIRVFVNTAADMVVATMAAQEYRGQDPMTRETLDATLAKTTRACSAAKQRLADRLSSGASRHVVESTTRSLLRLAGEYELARLNAPSIGRTLPTPRLIEVSANLLRGMETVAIVMMVVVP